MIDGDELENVACRHREEKREKEGKKEKIDKDGIENKRGRGNDSE